MTSPISSVVSASFLGCLPETAQDRLCHLAIPTELPAGQVLFDPDLTIVVDGRLRAFLTDGSARQLTVSYIQTPRALGIARVAGRDFPVGFQAVTDSHLLRLDRRQLDDLGRAHPDLGWAIARQIAHYLDDVLAETARVAFRPVRARVAHHLLELSSGQTSAAIHQADLAAAVGSVREVVARALGELRDDGLVSMGPSGVTVNDPTRLQRVATGRP